MLQRGMALTPEEQSRRNKERDMLYQLQALARGGCDPRTGMQVTMDQQMAALDRYNHLSAQMADRELARDRMNAELALAADKISIQKAEVAVKMLEVLVKAGVDPQDVLAQVAGMSDKLLSLPSALALEVKD